MSEKRFLISYASRKINVEAHVLRYWEEELGLEIERNEMGHRYYKKEDIELLKSVKELKDKGFQLKAIKLLLPEIQKVEELDRDRLLDLRDKLNVAVEEEAEGEVSEVRETEMMEEQSYRDEKFIRFTNIMMELMEEVVESNNEKLAEIIREKMINEIRYADVQTAVAKEQERPKAKSKFFKKYKIRI